GPVAEGNGASVSIAGESPAPPLPDCRAGSRTQISRAGHRLVAGGVIGFGLARRGDILGAGFLQDLLGSPGPVAIVRMNREQHAAALDASLIALGLIFRNAHTNQCAGETAHHTSSADSGQGS